MEDTKAAEFFDSSMGFPAKREGSQFRMFQSQSSQASFTEEGSVDEQPSSNPNVLRTWSPDQPNNPFTSVSSTTGNSPRANVPKPIFNSFSAPTANVVGSTKPIVLRKFNQAGEDVPNIFIPPPGARSGLNASKSGSNLSKQSSKSSLENENL